MNKAKNIKKSKHIPVIDEDSSVMIYGNLKITDKDTGKVLVNKRV